MTEPSVPPARSALPCDGAVASPVRWLIGAGLLVAALYALTSPGRIDIVDGQHRFEVAKNLLAGNGPVLLDPATIQGAAMSLVKVPKVYSAYAPGGALLGVPMLLIAALFGGQLPTQLFCFSLTSAFCGGLAATAYGAILHLHGLDRRRILLSIALLAVASPMWFMGTTVFHQLQFTAFIMVGLWCSFLAARRQSRGWALAAGLFAGFSIFAQESAVLLVPWVAVPLLYVRDTWSRRAYLVFVCSLGAAVWLIALMLANTLRFDDPFYLSKLENLAHPPMWGSFLLGFKILNFSIGKSWVLYAPTFVLALVGAAYAWRDAPPLVVTVLGLTLTQFLFTCCLTFCAGDWAWGPRYLLQLAPIISLTLPWLFGRRRWRYPLAAVLALSFSVQLLSVSVDHMRFFVEHKLSAFFWYKTPGYYFEHSQLFARLDEIRDLRLRKESDSLTAFRPGPYPELSSYASAGVAWAKIKDYPVYFLPRPWIFWIPCLPERLQPVNPLVATPLVLVVALMGVHLLRRPGRVLAVRRATTD